MMAKAKAETEPENVDTITSPTFEPTVGGYVDGGSGDVPAEPAYQGDPAVHPHIPDLD